MLKGYARELDECAKKLDAAQLEDSAAEAQRYAKSAEHQRSAQADRQSCVAQLRARLEALGASGIGEKLAQADAAIEQMENRHRELRLRADALDLLESVLVDARDTAVATLRDLAKPDVQSKFNGVVQGIEPGGGLMQASEKTLKAYDLSGYKLQSASEAGMLAAMQRVYQSQWIVATVWSPHWLFQKWQMRYLKDPKGTLGGEEQIHAFASKQFAGKFSRADVFFKHFKLTLADVEAIEFDGNSTNDYAAVAKKFVDAHPRQAQGVAATVIHTESFK